ncbi:translocation/assembly module TamB domain-containing protein [Christiangramia salexigens]|uniref:Translocation and assembly module TamB C-terminal domain-containing protein n=1 Tax=Christiangramia salexigens TaxID=1913577 RepID=A0A1L3J397_9FLAO|nr:translocation/assembly module TamB domain-containing protein [Christiangramia salexigens]APG59580.1 hypothetical protein LPB144_03775 [Christiangramia salexigens]
MTNQKTRLIKWLKILAKIVLGILVFLLLIILFIRSPWGQNIIKNKVISSIENKTGGNIDLERLFIEFNGDIHIDQLYIEDPKGDTLVYSERISANIGIMPLIKGNGFQLKDLDWKNVKANIYRKDSIQGFNYEFLLNAYVTKSEGTVPADTTASPMKIELGDIDLSDFNINYKDEITGIDTQVKFDQFNAEFSEIDIDKMLFKLGEINLSNARIIYDQTKAFPIDSSSTPAEPVFIVEELNINQVALSYNSKPDSLNSDINIKELQLINAGINMKQKELTGERISLSNSLIAVQVEEAKQSSPKKENTAASDFQWPNWVLDISEINFDNNALEYVVNNSQVQRGQFNPNAIKLDSLDLLAKNLLYREKNAKLKIEKFQFNEVSGLNLNKFNIELFVSDDQMQFNNINAIVNSSILVGNVFIDYKNLNSFILDPGTATVDIDLENLKLDGQELYRFQPDLRNNQYISSLEKSPVNGRLKANGTLNKLNISSANITWNQTTINGSGVLFNLDKPEEIGFNFPSLRLDSRRNDLINFVDEETLGLNLPEKVSLKGGFSGDLTNIKTNAILLTSDGDLSVTGNFSYDDDILFDARIKGDSIALGRLLKNEALGNLNLKAKISGSGNSVESLDLNLDSEISSFTYKNYEFRKIDLAADLKNGKGPVNLNYKDPNLDIEAQTSVVLDSLSPRLDFKVMLNGADLGELNLARRNIKTGFTLEGWFQGNSENYEASANITKGVAVFNNETYLLGDLQANAFVKPDSTSVKIDNRIINMELKSNASPNLISTAVNEHFKRYITENYKEDSIKNPVNLSLNAKISESPILTEVFLLNLKKFDTIDLNIDFREKERTLNADISIPHINYYSSVIDSLKLDVRSDATDLNFRFGFNELNAGPLAIKKTILDGKLINEKLNLEFTSIYKDKPIVHINSNLNFKGDTLKFHVEPKELILNGNPWSISSSNQVRAATEYLQFDDFKLFRNGQEMLIENDTPGIEKEHLSLSFKNFSLAALLNYLNPEEQLAQGNLNGNLIYEEPFGKTGLLADLEIDRFAMLGVDLNMLSLNANSSGFNNYDFEMFVKGGEVDLDLTGSYVASEESAILDMNLNLNEVKMTAIEGFSRGAIKNGSGSLSGNIDLNGTVAEPKYTGEIKFNEANFNVAAINTAFTLPDETIAIDEKSVKFDQFRIEDTRDNSIIVNGDINITNLLNPKFDLDVQAKNFQLLNSTEEDNDLFFGTAVVDVDAQVSGDLNLPVVNMDLRVNESTDFTYVIPKTELQIKEREGVVIFVNKENPDDILTQTEEESYVVSGYDIRSRLTVSKGAEFNVIINQETGDKFQVQGEGDLIFNMYPNGRLALTGVYEINVGFYEMSLYNLVKRRFRIAQGSRVSWAGDPFEAQLDVRAIYDVETSASSLMAAQLSGTDPSVTGRYRQELPFLVYLNVEGDLMEPKISFNLDMPEDEQGAIGGQVYGRIQQLNNQEDELNKQVFSLLVLNRFYPESGSDGSSGGTLAVARDNLNDALSDQLNMLSSRILGESGLKLNFEVDSYTDYQGDSPQDRTQLDISAQKAFMEDRLVVEVGSEVDIQGGGQPGQEAAPIIGNLSIAYLLDENGTWRIKGFRKNQYENVIDGQLIVSGISLIFTKEFNKFKNLFEKAVLQDLNKKAKQKSSEASKTDENEN